MIVNDLILKAANGQKTKRTPIWLMRQAGRILPQYRKVREDVGSFIKLVQTPDLAAEVTIQPVDILGVDAAIIFSDILVIPEAMGLPYKMVEGRGPYFEQTIKSSTDISKLVVADINNLKYVFDAIKLTKQRLNNRVPIIGFSGAPLTLLCYMVEGGGSKTFSKTRRLLYQDPNSAHKLLDMLADSVIIYLKEQIKSGADIVQIFDSWAGILGKEQYLEFGLQYIDKICNAIDEVPITVFAKGAYSTRREMGELSCNIIGLDWNMGIEESRKLIGENKTLQGNLDPCVLYGSEEVIEREARKMLKQFGSIRHIANLGHGVYPDLDYKKVKYFIDVVKSYS